MQALHLAARGNVHLDGLIASAAAVHIKRNLVMRLQEPFAALMRRLVPRAPIVPALNEELLSRDPAVVCSCTPWSLSIARGALCSVPRRCSTNLELLNEQENPDHLRRPGFVIATACPAPCTCGRTAPSTR
jgi:hypothetical protein